MATKIDIAVEWAVSIANSPAHGYDQNHRWGPDYDCSSLVISAYEVAGVPIRSQYGGTATWNMIDPLLKCGFVEVTNAVDFKTGNGLMKGDIIWRKGHVEMMASATTRVGAHIAENGTIYADEVGDQTGGEISVDPYKNNNWSRAFRYPSGSSETVDYISRDDVICSNSYLDRTEMFNNAIYIASYLYRGGWSLEAVAGVLGNMESESTMNPGLWESREQGNLSKGFGLTQWTPASKLIDWATAEGRDYTDIDTQLDRIIYELEEGIQYYPTDDYPETFEEFSVSTQTPEYLAAAFLFNYERPRTPKPEERGAQARYWYNILIAIDPDWLLQHSDRKRRGMPLFLMFMATRKV